MKVLFKKRINNYVLIQVLISLIPLIIFQFFHYKYHIIDVENKMNLILSLMLIFFEIIILKLQIKIFNKNETIDKLTKLEEDNGKLAAIIKYADDAIISQDLHNNIISWNKGSENIFGYKGEEVIGKNISILIPKDELQEMALFIKKEIDDREVECIEKLMAKKSGEKINVSITISPIIDDMGRKVGISFIARDIRKNKIMEEKLQKSYDELSAVYEELSATEGELREQYNELQKIEEKMRYMASYDQLTDLPNRNTFMESLKFAINKNIEEKSNGKIAVMFLDLDNFKKINDTLGHIYGDKLLKKVADILRLYLGGNSSIGRIGGDEFIIYLPCDSQCQEVIEFCENVILKLNENLVVDNKCVYVSVSMGASVFPDDSSDVNTLLKYADTAMYKAKKIGKNNYCFFSADIKEEIERKIAIEKGLRTALKNEELDIHYQPQVDVKNRKIVGFEALLRWNSREFGMVSPTEFIPIAEETGLIISIGDWIINKVCKQVVQWVDKDYDISRVEINISAVQIQNRGFADRVKKIIKRTSVNPKYLEFEITETILMESLENNIKILQEFRDLNIKVALDDFGIGYSSFNYLKNLPISTIKIDKSFIDNIGKNNSDKDITHGIIKLAHNINMEVIAEGVEEEEQVFLLEDMRCDRIQGYYFSRPLQINKAEELLMNIGK
ncbi:MAG: EAL domain-containing protein [Clostridiaceae bacterium]